MAEYQKGFDSIAPDIDSNPLEPFRLVLRIAQVLD